MKVFDIILGTTENIEHSDFKKFLLNDLIILGYNDKRIEPKILT